MPCRTTAAQRDLLCNYRALRWAAVVCFAQIVLVTLGISAPALGEEPMYWNQDPRGNLRAHLRLLGHRNWIVVADSAYPWQSRPGIQTVYIHEDHVKVVETVLREVDAAKNVRPIVYLDAELKSVAEEDAPGVEVYRNKLAALLKKRPVKTMLHEDVIAKLDEAAKTFRILILKTDMAIPYTTVFIELDCGYWSAEKEKRLRQAMGAEAK
jgi:L-fucose mutarotase/ribose pyranase (RbsD/FucU family)